MDLQELRQEAIKIIKANPELKSEIQDLFSLAISEVEEGGSESHECDLAYNDMIELQNEANNNKMVRGGKTNSTELFDLEYGDVFEITAKGHTLSYQTFVFIRLQDFTGPVLIQAKRFPSLDDTSTLLYQWESPTVNIGDIKDGDIKILSKAEAGKLLMDYYIRYDKFKDGGKLTGPQQAKFDKVMSEWKAGKLHSGSSDGPIVTDQDQAIAIAYAQANGMKKMEFGGLVYDSLSDEAKDRMDGLVPTEQINNVLSNCRYIVSQMMEEGFELDEAISFIVYKIVDDFTDKQYGYFSDEYYPEDWKETGGSVEDDQIEEYAEAIYEDLRQEYKPYELQNMSMEEAMMSVDSYDEIPENLKEEVASYLMNMAGQNEFFEEDEEYAQGGVIENKMQSLENELNRLESELKWTQQQNGASKQYYLRKRRSGKMTRERAMELIDQSNASWKKEREKVREKIKEVKDRIKRLEELSSKVNADQFAYGGGISSIKVGDEVIWKGNKYLLTNITSDTRSGFYDKKYFLSSNQVGVSDAILDSLKDVKKNWDKNNETLDHMKHLKTFRELNESAKDYSEASFKLDKFMPDDQEVMDEYYSIIDDPKASEEEKASQMVEFIETYCTDEEKMHSYFPQGGTVEEFAAYLVANPNADIKEMP